ncbi:MAG TPA: FAD-binding oxidoreductase [Dongiaceae bacterium]|nr:FAD-binding oxidoreductase [Dongiaceae bacterium]
MSRRFDVVIVGGGVIGSSAAYFLAAERAFGGSIAVIERDATYAEAATPRSAGGIRQQFSTPENVLISAFGASFIKSAKEHLTVGADEPDLQFHEGGYLFLATGAGLATLIANQQLQRQLGAETQLLNPKELAGTFPWLNCADLAGGSFGPRNEGWLDPYSLLQAFRRKARALGVTYIQDEVTGLDIAQNRVRSVSLRSGEAIACGAVINCAGVSAWRIAAWAGLDLPVRPRKRLVYVFDCREELTGVPLTIDPSGVWVRPEGANFICGVSPEEGSDPDSTDFEIDYGLFEETIWPTLAHRVPAFEAIKLIRAWAGHYDYNVLDQNVIVGAAPDVPNFLMANGFSGHGLQQSPAIGRALSELVTFGAFRTLDLRRFGYDRVLSGQAIREANVV